MPKRPLKILYTADLHLRDTIPSCRLDDFKEAQFTKLAEVGDIIRKEKIDMWLNGGDLFDEYNVSYEIVNRFTEFFISLPAGVHMYSVEGNHDMLAYNEKLLNKTALGNLIVNGHISLLPNTVGPLSSDGRTIYVKGINANKTLKYSEYDIDTAYYPGPTFIVTHDPIVEEPAIFDHMLIKDVAKATNADFVLCSHIHEQFDITVGKTRFINPGPIFRQTVNEIDMEPKLCILEV